MPYHRLTDTHGRALASPVGEVAQDARADCDGEGYLPRVRGRWHGAKRHDGEGYACGLRQSSTLPVCFCKLAKKVTISGREDC